MESPPIAHSAAASESGAAARADFGLAKLRSSLGPDTAETALKTSPDLPVRPPYHGSYIAGFLVLGFATMYYWNAVLNVLYAIVLLRFPQYAWLGDTYTASYTTTACITAFVLSWRGALSKWLNYGGAIVMALLAISFPAIAIGIDGKAGVIVLVVNGCLSGVAAACFQCSNFAFATVLPQGEYGSKFGAGLGFSGIISFGFWMLFSSVSFDIQEPSGAKRALWAHFSIAAVVMLAACGVSYYLQTTPPMIEVVSKHHFKAMPSSDMHPDLETADKDVTIPPEVAAPEVYTRLSHWAVFKKTWMMQLGISLQNGLSMMAYPNIGPYGWALSIRKNDVLTGIFQIADPVGRWIPALLPAFFFFGQKLTFGLTWLRFILLGLFIAIAKQVQSGETDNVLHNYGAQIVLFLAMALSHGWYDTIYMGRVTENVSHPLDIARAASMAVCLLILFIAVGLWFAKLV